MTPERWQRLSQLYHEARARSDEERTTFLAEACRDDEPLRREVERLLVGETSAEQLLDGGALRAAAQMVSTVAGSVLTGRRVGSYQVGARLGAGGMGEVYRARDSRLGRDVAIKILPPAFTSDPERRARFEREARMVAALNHPNIAAIYGVEEADGIRALVLELVEGETLADRIARGALAQNDALGIARQIAEALAAAHEKGIVHRDLKPANIKITPDGLVKVLDFGLAKAATGEVSGTDLTQSPTLTIGGTRDGVILGTAAYMSPEQARGQTVDKRTDIWAFGCVLYEMLTGRAAFARDTVTDTLAAIVEREPAWDTLPASTPTAVRRLLRRCLEKDSRRRLHDIADARIELEDVQSGAGAEAPALPAGKTTWARWSLVTALVLAAMAALAWIGWTGRSDPTRSGITRVSIAAAGTAAVSPGRGIAITPDGSRVVWVGNKGTQLFVQVLGQLEVTPLVTGVAPLNWLMLSPDGTRVGFIEGSQVKKIAIAGGPASLITVNTSASLTGAAWLADDTIVLASDDPATGLVQVSASGGDQTVLTRPDPSKGERDHLWPEPLPGGRSVLFTITATTGGPKASQIAVLDLMTRTVTPVANGGSDARYVSSGHLVYVADGAMRAIAFDLDGLKTRGDSVIVMPRFRSAEGASGFDVSANGTIAYVDDPGTVVANTLVWVDRQSREEPLGADPHAYFHPRLSPDETRVAVTINDDEGGHIWLWELARPGLTQLAPGFAPVWTRDSKHLLYFGRNDGLWRQPADGMGTARRIASGLPSFVTSDFRVIFSPGARDISILSLDGPPAEARLVSDEAAAERNAVVSPNDRWLAYESDEDGRFDIYVRPFQDVTKGPWKVSTDAAGGTRPLWSPRGDELFYVAPNGTIMGVRVDPSATTWSASAPVKILEGPYATTGAGSPRTYDVDQDGRFLMVKRPAAQSATPQIIVVQDWLAELKRLVPSF